MRPVAAPGPAGRPLAMHFGGLDGGAVKDRGQHLVQLLGGHALHGLFPGDQFLLFHFDGEADGGQAGAFAVAGLEHEDFAVLDGELEVLHVAEMAFQGLADLFQFLGGCGHDLGQFGHGLGRAHAGHHVLALGVDEEFAVKDFFAGGGVAGEGDAGAGLVAGVAEDHGLHADGGAPFGGDVVFAAIDDGAVVHPGAEDGADGAFQLLPRIGGEFLAGALLDQGLEALDQLPAGRRRQCCVSSTCCFAGEQVRLSGSR